MPEDELKAYIEDASARTSAPVLGGGWKPPSYGHSARRCWWTDETGARLTLPFECVADGCGVLVEMTVSWQPMASASFYIDGELVAHNVSATSPSLVHGDHKWTVGMYVMLSAPRGTLDSKACEASASQLCGGLRAGNHTLTVETLKPIPLASTLRRLPWSFGRHEYHIRGLVVVYEPPAVSDMATQQRQARKSMR